MNFSNFSKEVKKKINSELPSEKLFVESECSDFSRNLSSEIVLKEKTQLTSGSSQIRKRGFLSKTNRRKPVDGFTYISGPLSDFGISCRTTNFSFDLSASSSNSVDALKSYSFSTGAAVTVSPKVSFPKDTLKGYISAGIGYTPFDWHSRGQNIKIPVYIGIEGRRCFIDIGSSVIIDFNLRSKRRRGSHITFPKIRSGTWILTR